AFDARLTAEHRQHVQRRRQGPGSPPNWGESRPPITLSTCRRTAFTPVRRATRPLPTSLHMLAMLGRKPRVESSPLSSPTSGAVVEARDIYKTYVMGRLRVPAL